MECSSETCINSSDCRLAEELLFHGQSVATPRSDWAVSQLRRTRAFVDLCARLPGMPIGDVDIDEYFLKSEMDEMRKIFEQFDEDKSGSVDANELRPKFGLTRSLDGFLSDCLTQI